MTLREAEETPRRYALMAAVFDVLAGNLVLAFGLACLRALRPEAASIEGLWIAQSVLVVMVVSYHLLGAHRVDFLSPGERLAGGTHALRGKTWHRTFQRSRGALFLVVAVSLAVASRAWGGGWQGSLSPTDLLVGIVLAALVLSGSFAACGGSREAILWLCVYHGLVGAMHYRLDGGPGVPWDALGDSASFRFALATVCLVLFFWYRRPHARD